MKKKRTRKRQRRINLWSRKRNTRREKGRIRKRGRLSREGEAE